MKGCVEFGSTQPFLVKVITAENVSEDTRGDVNSDGEFNVADVVLLQKWLPAVPDTNLTNWKAASFLYDDRLDVFDL